VSGVQICGFHSNSAKSITQYFSGKVVDMIIILTCTSCSDSTVKKCYGGEKGKRSGGKERDGLLYSTIDVSVEDVR
jgi:hypothetical protein